MRLSTLTNLVSSLLTQPVELTLLSLEAQIDICHKVVSSSLRLIYPEEMGQLVSPSDLLPSPRSGHEARPRISGWTVCRAVRHLAG